MHIGSQRVEIAKDHVRKVPNHQESAEKLAYFFKKSIEQMTELCSEFCTQFVI
jgi:hypothetical protein